MKRLVKRFYSTNDFSHFYLNPHLKNASPSPTFTINLLTKKLICEGKDIIKFGLG